MVKTTETKRLKPSGERQSHYSAPALEKGFKVIELLADTPQGLTISEMATRLGFGSISEIFRIIIVMERRGWLHKNPDSDRFTVTHKVLELAFRATPAQELALVAAPIMRELAHALDQSCHMVVRNGSRGLVVLRQENPGPTVFAVRLGADIELHHSCSGHVLLAFADPTDFNDKDWADIVTASAPSGLIDHLAKVRQQGYELQASARTRGVTDMSYPIFGFDGRIVAALTIPYMELIDGSRQVKKVEARKALKTYAERISRGLGGVV